MEFHEIDPWSANLRSTANSDQMVLADSCKELRPDVVKATITFTR
jgi:hypothetical protein